MSKKSTYVITTIVLLLLISGISHADLVGHWRLDEGAGTIAYDSSGHANDGVLEGNTQWDQGVLGGAIKGNGTNTFVRVPHSPSLTIRNAITVALWLSGGVPAYCPISKGGWLDAYAIRFDGRQGRERKLNWRGRINPPSLESGAELPEDEWVHVAVTFDVDAPGNNQRIYINGDLDAANRSDNPLSTNTHDVRLGAEAVNNTSRGYFNGMLDDIRIYNTALSADQIPMIMNDRRPELAYDPSPIDNANDVPRDMILHWVPGKFTLEHTVYFGTSWNDVNEASVDNPLGVLLSQGQDTNEFIPAGLLDFGQAYYWRVDEVSGAPDHTVFKGEVWGFEVEPFSIPITNIRVTASSSPSEEMVPENTVNGSGLNALNQHSTDAADMWISGIGDAAPSIQYEFDRPYKLHEMWVWNSNQLVESFTGLGAKDVTIEISLDGTTWSPLEDVPPLAQAPGSDAYVANTIIDFAGAMARYVKITINSGYGTVPQYGLSEVRFLYVPAHPRILEPADGALADGTNVNLSWRPGREAVSHQVCLSTDPMNLELVSTTSEPTYVANGLNYGTTYYWCVTEVNDAEDVSSYTGEIWSFTTPEFGVVDDFEQYNDSCKRIFFIWEDGSGHNGGKDIDCDMPPSPGNGGGSIVGHAQDPFTELGIVHSGRKSMPLTYDNAFGPSEATLSLVGLDWTASEVQTLSLFFYGQPGNRGQLYVKINNIKVAYDGQDADITRAQWHPWSIDLNAMGDTLQNVTSLTMGVDGDNAAGLLYIDDIRLYPKAGEFITPKEPGTANLVALYAFEGNYTDSVGGHDAIEMGMPQIINDPARGQVLSLDGGGDALKVAYSAALNPTEFTASLWALVNPNSSGSRSLIWSRDWDLRSGYSVGATNDNRWSFKTMQGTNWQGNATIGLGPAVLADEWTHVGITHINEEKKLYINGRVVAEGRAPLQPNTTLPLGIGCDPEGYNFFTGLIDELRIYNQALSSEELAWLADRRMPMHRPFTGGQEVDDPHLLAHWKLDEFKGNIAADSAGEKDATVIGEATWKPGQGMVDGALQCDGIDIYVDTPLKFNPIAGPFSVLAWIKGGVPGQVILSQTGGLDWLVADPEQGRLMSNLTEPAKNVRGKIKAGPALISTTVITDGQWHRVGLVWDGVNRVLYVDDIEVARDTLTELEGSDSGIIIGAGSSLEASAFWSGMIDDVRIYDRVVEP
jgi:hypothetical protein